MNQRSGNERSVKERRKGSFSLFANWKMYALEMSVQDYFSTLLKELTPKKTLMKPAKGAPALGFALPFTKIEMASQLLGNFPIENVPGLEEEAREIARHIGIGAQNMHSAQSGAFTGEIALDLLKEAKASWSLVGHSERREHFGESDEEIAQKVSSARKAAFDLLICVGEKAQDREGGRGKEVVAQQVMKALAKAGSSKQEIWIAYEPVWAIGQKKSACIEEIEEISEVIEEVVTEKLSFDRAKLRLFYGGAVDLTSAKEIAAIPSLDGLLVGRASLDPSSFAALANSVFASYMV